MRFNINNYVKIRLNDLGRKNYSDFYTRFGIREAPIKEDKNGWSEWPMWEVMQLFCKNMGLGSELPFDAEIEIVSDDAKK